MPKWEYCACEAANNHRPARLVKYTLQGEQTVAEIKVNQTSAGLEYTPNYAALIA